MGTQHAHRAVVKRNYCAEDRCNNAQRVSASHQSPVQQLNGIECMCMSQCL